MSKNKKETSIEYYAIAYYRLSKDDRGKNESDSIANQRKLMETYLENNPNIKKVDEAYDDGYTGTNFERPGFRVVMEAIESKRVNCVIVKDLSRLGREYIQVGNYLERVFPSMGVRFIAINDDIDSNHSSDSDDIIIPIKNIMNESYCRALSKSLRKQFRMQRVDGEFMGAFASYGYRKSPDDKHKLIIDDYAAEVVTGIFSLKIRGYSQQGIADYLNQENVLPPAAYKRSLGLNYKSGFKGAKDEKWSAVAVTRILTNPIYIGTLVQGKRGKPNFKSEKVQYKDEAEWIVVENNHPPIVDPLLFQTVAQMLTRDTHVSKETGTVNVLGGILTCGDCGRNMIVRSVTRSGKKFYYYMCASYKEKKCTLHNIQKNIIEEIILNAINTQINLMIELDELVNEVGLSALENSKLRKFDMMIAQKNAELDAVKEKRISLYESFSSRLISREEYDEYRGRYNRQIGIIEDALLKLKTQRKTEEESSSIKTNWIQQFIRFKGASELTREIVVTLIDRVYVYEDKRVRIDFNFKNEYEVISKLVEEKLKEVG